LPLAWIAEALIVLQRLGYIVAGKGVGVASAHSHGAATNDPQYPAYPPEAVQLAKLQVDLASPMQQWLAAWPASATFPLPQALKVLDETKGGAQTLAQVLPLV